MQEQCDAILALFDLAERLAKKEGKSHRETFNLLLDYIVVTVELKEKTEELEQLDEQIKDLKAEAVILTAIQQGKIAKG